MSEETAVNQPDELNALKEIVKEFITKITTIDNEIELLKQDRKDVCEEYKEKLDYKTLQAALKVVKIMNKINSKDTFDTFIEILNDNV